MVSTVNSAGAAHAAPMGINAKMNNIKGKSSPSSERLTLDCTSPKSMGSPPASPLGVGGVRLPGVRGAASTPDKLQRCPNASKRHGGQAIDFLAPIFCDPVAHNPQDDKATSRG